MGKIVNTFLELCDHFILDCKLFTYAPDNQWFIRTMNIVFELGGDLVRKEVAHNLMRLIAEGVATGSHDPIVILH